MNVICINDDSIALDTALIKINSKYEGVENFLEYIRAYNNKLNVRKDDNIYPVEINKPELFIA